MKLNLSEILQEAEAVKAQGAIKNSANQLHSQLKNLGFEHLADRVSIKLFKIQKLKVLQKFKYVQITEEKIKLFLKRKVEEYNKINHEKSNLDGIVSITGNYMYYSNSTIMWTISDEASVVEPPKKVFVGTRETYSEHTCDYMSNDKGSIGQFVWEETPLHEVEQLPPRNVLKTLDIHKSRKIFDYFTIAKVKGLYDPILFGRLLNSSDRYFIAQWGDDVNLDDVI